MMMIFHPLTLRDSPVLTRADHDSFIHFLTYLTHTERDFAPAFLFTLMEARWPKTSGVLPDDSTKDMRVRHSAYLAHSPFVKIRKVRAPTAVPVM